MTTNTFTAFHIISSSSHWWLFFGMLRVIPCAFPPKVSMTPRLAPANSCFSPDAADAADASDASWRGCLQAAPKGFTIHHPILVDVEVCQAWENVTRPKEWRQQLSLFVHGLGHRSLAKWEKHPKMACGALPRHGPSPSSPKVAPSRWPAPSDSIMPWRS